MIIWRSFQNWTEAVGPVTDTCRNCGADQRVLIDFLQKEKLYSVIPMGTQHDFRLICECGKSERVLNPMRMRRLRAEAVTRVSELAAPSEAS